jgi:tetratricopeptide (TPR) repeat protein
MDQPGHPMGENSEAQKAAAGFLSLATPAGKALASFILFCAVAWVFLPATQNGFVNYDDPDYVLNNSHVRSGLSAENIGWAFRSAEAGNWHPLTWISHMVDCQLFGLNPARHHLVNVLFHAANAVLLFLALSRLTGFPGRCLFVAALFALHPLRVQSVAWIAERKDVLSAFFFTATLWAYARYGERGRRSEVGGASFPAALGLFTLGLMSKPMLVTLPCVLLLLDFWPLGRVRRENIARLLLEKIPFFIAAAGASAATLYAQKNSGAVRADLSLLLRAENAAVSYVRYLGKLFVPADLSVFYPHPRQWPMLWVAGAVVFLLMISAVAVLQLRKRPWLATGWFWYLGALVPAIGLVQVGVQSMADRYTYIPLIGIGLVLTWTAAEYLGHTRLPRAVVVGVGAALLVACSVCTRREIGFWRTSEALFTRAIAVTKDNYMAHFYLGLTYQNEGNLDRAIAEFEEALRLRPNTDFCNTFGIFLERQGRLDEAIARFQQSVGLDPSFADPHRNLALALAKKGAMPEAITELQTALKLDPANAGWHNDLAALLSRAGQLDDAIVHFQESLRLQGDSPDVCYNLGNALLRKGRIEEAVAQFEKALALNPGSADVHNNLGIALTRQGKLPEAIRHFEEAIRIRPGYSDAEKNLAAAVALSRKQGGTPPQ